MAARPHATALRRLAQHATRSSPSPSTCTASRVSRTFSTARPCPAPANPEAPRTYTDSSRATSTTHFGFEDGVSEADKTERVADVFHKVADTYDKMNDLMSFGWHRVWKDHFVRSLNPGYSASTVLSDAPPRPQHILDVAGGTGDIAFRHLAHAHDVNHNPDTRVTISDINPSMLAVGASRARAQLPASQLAALSFLEADGTRFTPERVPDASVDLYTVAFGIRNFSNVAAGLAEAYRVLRPGGVFACLEFGKIRGNPVFDAVYKRWSFGGIPLVGQLVAGDRDSYQYLVESIERFPAQPDFRDMIAAAGFDIAGQGWEDLTGGVAAIHKGIKPLNA